MESGPSRPRRATSWSLVSSPSAAKIGAALLARMSALDELLDELRLSLPTAFVHRERLRAALERDLVEPRFGDPEERFSSPCRGLELERDERRLFLRVIDALFDGGRMPAEREQALVLDAVHDEVEGSALERLLRLNRKSTRLNSSH